MENGTASPQIVHREGVTEAVQSSGGWIKAEPFAEVLNRSKYNTPP
jgi:hypothetical protein